MLVDFKNKMMKQLKEMVKNKPVGDEFRCSFIMFALKSFLCPKQTPVTSPTYLFVIIDVENPMMYNWSVFIHSILVDSIKKYKSQGTCNINACIFVLMAMQGVW